MERSLNTTPAQPRSRAVRDKDADFSPKAIDDVGEALDLFRQLDTKSRAKFIAFCKWICDDRSPETDPRKIDPFWQDFPDCLAVKVRAKAA